MGCRPWPVIVTVAGARVAAAHGGEVDNIGNLDRVLRVPGTENVKGEPVMATLEPAAMTPGRALSLAEVVEVLDRFDVPDVEPSGPPARAAQGIDYADLRLDMRRRVDGHVKAALDGIRADAAALLALPKGEKTDGLWIACHGQSPNVSASWSRSISDGGRSWALSAETYLRTIGWATRPSSSGRAGGSSLRPSSMAQP